MYESFEKTLNQFNDAYDSLVASAAEAVLSEVARLIGDGLPYDAVPAEAEKLVYDVALVMRRHGRGLMRLPSHIVVPEIYVEIERVLAHGGHKDDDLLCDLEVCRNWDTVLGKERPLVVAAQE